MGRAFVCLTALSKCGKNVSGDVVTTSFTLRLHARHFEQSGSALHDRVLNAASARHQRFVVAVTQLQQQGK